MSTIQTNTTLALNGSAGLTVGADTLSWSNRWLDTVNFTSGTSKLALTAAANLSGANWSMRNLVFSATNGLAAQITDQDAATGRYIENVVLGSKSVVRLQSTGIGTMTGSAGVDDIVTGSAYVAKIARFWPDLAMTGSPRVPAGSDPSRPAVETM